MSEPNAEFVKMYDLDTRETTLIPAAELAAGMVRIQLGNTGEIVWVDAARLEAAESDHRHPPLSGELREKVLYIAQSLAVVFPKTYEEWEDGFRRDLHVDQEVDIWVRLCRCLKDFTEQRGSSPDEQQEAFEVLAVCMNTTPSTVFETMSPRRLDRATAKQLVDAFFSDEGEE